MQFSIFQSFVQTSVQAGDTISNTAASTPFATKYTIPASTIFPGTVMFIYSGGQFSTPLVANRALSLDVLVGGNGLMGSGSRTPTAPNVTNSPWTMEARIICTLDGVNGLMEGDLICRFYDATLSGIADNIWTNGAETGFVIDTTVDNDVQLAAQYAVADVNNSITMRHLIVTLGAS